jgi:uncharacterized membrane protein YjfL (UPF0719 family)
VAVIGALIIAGTCFETWTLYKESDEVKNNNLGKNF